MSAENIVDFKVVRKQISNKARGCFNKSWALYVSKDDEDTQRIVGYLHEYLQRKITGKGEEKFVLRYKVEWNKQLIASMFKDYIGDHDFFHRRFRVHEGLVDCIKIYYEMIDCLNDYAEKNNAPLNFYRSR